MDAPTQRLKTRVFDLAPANGYRNDAELAAAMGISQATVSRVRRGLMGINDVFITGAQKAFPRLSLDEMFVVETDTAEHVA